MKIVKLDGERMLTKELTHEYLKSKLELPEYYGENLDSLWDILSSYSEPLEIRLYNNRLVEYLGEYGQSILELLGDLPYENENIDFIIDSRRK